MGGIRGEDAQVKFLFESLSEKYNKEAQLIWVSPPSFPLNIWSHFVRAKAYVIGHDHAVKISLSIANGPMPSHKV